MKRDTIAAMTASVSINSFFRKSSTFFNVFFRSNCLFIVSGLNERIILFPLGENIFEDLYYLVFFVNLFLVAHQDIFVVERFEEFYLFSQL